MADTGAGGQVTGFLSDAGITLPSFSWSGVSTWALYIIGGILLVTAVIFGVWWIIQYYKWNKKVMLFRKVANRTIPVSTDKAMFERVGQSGDYWLKTKSLKKTLPRPKIEMGVNTYWFYEREDGEWINFELSDIDAQMKQAGAYYVDEDMRLQRLGIQKNLQSRFIKESFWQKYGTTIMLVIFCLLVTVCLVVLFQKMTDNWKQAEITATAIEHMATSVDNMARNIGGGVVPAG
jgi:hypothetical protein